MMSLILRRWRVDDERTRVVLVDGCLASEGIARMRWRAIERLSKRWSGVWLARTAGKDTRDGVCGGCDLVDV